MADPKSRVRLRPMSKMTSPGVTRPSNVSDGPVNVSSMRTSSPCWKVVGEPFSLQVSDLRFHFAAEEPASVRSRAEATKGSASAAAIAMRVVLRFLMVFSCMDLG